MLTDTLGEYTHYRREQEDEQAKRLVCFHPIVQVEYLDLFGVEGLGELSMLSDLFRDSALEAINILSAN